MKTLLHVLTDNYHSEDFPEIVLDIEEKIKQGVLSDEWRKAYDKYCSTNKPKSDDFSYYELGDVFLEELGGEKIFKKIKK